MSKLKYTLTKQISLLPRHIKLVDLENELQKVGISKSTFSRDLKIKATDKTSIPSDRLDAYAIIFGCTANELKNYEVKGKSIHQLLGKKIKTGLS